MNQADPDRRQRPDDRKMEELILYIAAKCDGDPKFGATKLNKALFYSDFMSFQRHGRSITGHQYRRLNQGPVPRLMPKFQSSLQERGDAVIQERDVGGYKQKRTVALRPANLDGFSGNEIAIVDEAIEMLRPLDAWQVSELSHRFLGWQAASDGEDIPFSTAFVSVRTPTEAEVAHARTL